MVVPLIPLALLGGGAVIGGVTAWNLKRRPQQISEFNTQNITSYQTSTQQQIFTFEDGSNASNITIGQEANLQSDQAPILSTQRSEGIINNKTIMYALIGVGGYFVLKSVGVLK